MKRKWVWILIGVMFLCSTIIVEAAEPVPADEMPLALILLKASSTEEMDAVILQVEDLGGRVLFSFPNQGLIARLPFELEGAVRSLEMVRLVSFSPISAEEIEKSVSGADDGAYAAALGFSGLVDPESHRGPEEGGELPADDLEVSEDYLQQEPLAPDAAPTNMQTSEYMVNRVQVDIFLLESDGGVDTQTENWTTTMRDEVITEITAGLNWWDTTDTQGGEPESNLEFNLVFHTPWNDATHVDTDYEPIKRNHTDQNLWMDEIMDGLGYSESDYVLSMRNYVHDRRNSQDRDWGLIIWVINSLADTDGKFADGWFAYARLMGPYMVLTYDNDGWGIDEMDLVTAHELGHIFGASDEYAASGCTGSETSGYLNITNTNCVNFDPTPQESIMIQTRDSYTNHSASTPARQAIGWRDSDGDNDYDPVDTTPNVTLTAYTPDPTTDNTPIWSGSVTDPPYVSPTRTDLSINNIQYVRYRIDGGSWINCSATDGAFDETDEAFTCAPAALSDGVHTIEVIARNRVNHDSAIRSDAVRIDTVAPTNPTTVTSSSHTLSVWSNDNTVAVAWSGASDSNSGIKGYSYSFTTSSTTIPDTIQDTTGTTATSPALANGSSWYFHVRTVDNAGNWNSGAKHYGPFFIDVNAPTNPTGFNPGCGATSDVWQSYCAYLTASWTGAADTGGSGVEGFYYYFGSSSTGTSTDFTIYPNYNTPSAPNPSVYYFRLRTKDVAGNVSAWATMFILRYDAEAPLNPTSVDPGCTATSGVWQNTCQDPNFAWSGATDGSGSGIAKYFYCWSSSSSCTPTTQTTTPGYDPPAGSSTFSYYLRVSVEDAVYNRSNAVTLFNLKYDGTPPSNPTGFNSSHSLSTWYNSDNTIDISWTGAGDTGGSGVHGYSILWHTTPDALPDTVEDTTSLSTTSPPLSDSSSWYFHVRTRDNVGNWASTAAHYGPFWIDTHAPSNPTSVSPNCTAANNTWQRTCGDPNFTWSGASDGAGSGIYGYYYYFGPDSGGTSSDFTTNAGYDPGAVPSPSTYYLRVATVDNLSLISAWTTLYTFKYDASPPTNPSAYTSDPAEIIWTNDNTVSGIVSGHSDGAGSGVAGFSYIWSTYVGDAPDTTMDTSSAAINSPALADGASWYLHVRSVDAVGNWTATAAHFGPYKIDTTAPVNPVSANPGCTASSDVWQKTCSQPAFTWTGDGSGSGINGYYYYWGGDPAGTSGTYITSASFTPPSAVSSPSVNYLRLRSKDNAGNMAAGWTTVFILRYDASPPSNPTALASSSHIPGIWSVDNSIDAAWSGASDGAGSGLGGYSIQWSTMADTLPDGSVDTGELNATSAMLADGNSWYFHLRTCDMLGNCAAAAVHLGPFWIDVTAPDTAIIGVEQQANILLVTWGGTDSTSGITTYDVQYRIGPEGEWTDWLVDTSLTSAQFGPTSPVSLEYGQTIYFRVRARDAAGNVELYPDGDGDQWIVFQAKVYLPNLFR